jgi:GNAT superfamily N-acetyltransferase
MVDLADPCVSPALIRLACRADLPCLPGIERSAAALFAGTELAHLAQGPTMALRDLEAGCKAGTLWVADVDGPVGFLVGATLSGWLHLQELSVAAHAQRRGLGAALMKAAIAAAPALGVTRLSLVTDRWLPWNAPFYARLGYREVAASDCGVPPWLAAKLNHVEGSGLDPARRCIMVRDA